MDSDKPHKKSFLLATALAAVSILALGAGGASAQAPVPKTQGKPVIRAVHVKAAAPSGRVVTIATAGRRFHAVVVCDLQASSCVNADRIRRNTWRAALPSQDPAGPYRIGVVARSGHDFVTKTLGTAAAAPPFMP
jgi:hypothetical protein